MALPAQRTNHLLNPSFENDAATWVTTGCAVISTTGFSQMHKSGGKIAQATSDGTSTTPSISVTGGSHRAPITAGQWASFRVFTASESGYQTRALLNFRDAAGVTLLSTGGNWENATFYTGFHHSLTVQAPANAASVAVYIYFRDGANPAVAVPSGKRMWVDVAQLGIGATQAAAQEQASEYFDGSTVEVNWTHKWNGAAHASTSTRDYYGVWVEQSADAGAPKVQVTAIGLGNTPVITKVVREAAGETWTVPGWKRRNTLGGDTRPDHSPPLGRPVTYTLYVNGNAVSSKTITVTSTSGWVQSPIQPDLAMPIGTTGDNPNQLALAKPSLKEVAYESRGEEEFPMGGSYPIARAATRGAAGGLSIVLNARTDAVSDEFLALMKASPILLFRPHPSWGSLPALAYLRGNVIETPLTRDVGQGFTRWTADGRLVAPVATAPLTGTVTNGMVATNLAGRTHSSIAAVSSNKRHIDIAANPLGLGA